MFAFLMLMIRERLAVVRRGGLAALAVRGFGLAAMALLIAPAGLGIGLLTERVREPHAFAAVVTFVTASLFALWTISGVVFGASLSAELDLGAAASLPLRFSSVYMASVLYGLAGSWLIYVAPPLLWFAMRGRAAAGSAAIVLFALTTSRLISIGRAIVSSAARGWRGAALLWIAFTAFNALVFGFMYHRDTLTRDSAALLRAITAWDLAARLRFTPPGAVANAVLHDGAQPLPVLMLWLAATCAIDYALVYRRLFVKPSSDHSSDGGSRLIGVAARYGAGAALLARELVTLLRLRPFRMLFVYGLSYFLVYPLLIPAGEIDARFAAVLATMPFIFFSGALGNLLGIDYRSVPELLLLPVTARRIVATKATAATMTAAILSLEAIATLAMTGKLHGGGPLLLAFLAGLIALALACGSALSVSFATPVDLRTQYSVGNDAGSMLVFVAAGAWLALGALFAAFVPIVIAAGVAWFLYLRAAMPFAADRVDGRRDTLLDRLANIGRTA